MMVVLAGCATPPSQYSNKSYSSPSIDKPTASLSFGTGYDENNYVLRFSINSENPDDNCIGKFELIDSQLRRGVIFFKNQDVPDTKVLAGQPISILASQNRGGLSCTPPPLKFIPQADTAYRLTIRPYATGARYLGGCGLSIEQISPNPGKEIIPVTYVPFCNK